MMNETELQEFKDKWAAVRGRTVTISRDGGRIDARSFELLQLIPKVIDHIDKQSILLKKMDEAFIKLYMDAIPSLKDAENHARRTLQQYKDNVIKAIEAGKI